MTVSDQSIKRLSINVSEIKNKNKKKKTREWGGCARLLDEKILPVTYLKWKMSHVQKSRKEGILRIQIPST